MDIQTRPTARRTASRLGGILLLAGAITLALASAVHFGVALPLGFITIHDPFSGAAIPEAVLAAIVAAGSLCVLTGIRPAWWIGVVVTTIAVLVVLFGMSITVRSGRGGDVAYHTSLLVALLAAGVLLLRKPTAGRKGS